MGQRPRFQRERKRLRFNERKLQTLAIFQRYGLLSPRTWAVLAGFYPTRAAYSYLGRLHRFGLLHRQRDVRGLVLYRLSDKGSRRLHWLKGF
jgi:hypothetical protein